MTIEGRISVDALFHDKDGTSAVNVLSLGSSVAYESGSVAMIAGACGEVPVSIDLGQTNYRDASGNIVALSAYRVAFKASGNGGQLYQANGSVRIISSGEQVSTSEIDEQEFLYVSALSGTTAYSVLVYSQ